MKKTVKLDDILSITRGASPRPISNYITNESDGVNWIKIGDVDPNSFFITHTEEKITKEGAKKSRYVKEGDFILSNSMSFGRPYILKINGCVHDGWLILSDYENYVTSSYLYYLLRSPIVQNQFDGSANGATVRNLNSDIVRKVSVSIHTDKTDQQKIAAHLDSIQSAIDNKKQQLSELDELVKSKFVEMFGENPVENGKWKVVTIEKLCSIITDGTHQPPKFQAEGIPFLFVSNIITNEITYETEKFISEETYNQLIKRTPIEIGDIILSTVGSYGHPAIVKTNQLFLFQRHIAYLKPIRELVNSEYLKNSFLTSSIQNQIEEKVNGVAQKTLNLKDIRSLKLSLPPIELQNTFAAYVQKIDSAKSIIKNQLVDLQELLDSKMDEYFGE